MLSSAFADGPFPRRHTRITKSHPESSAGSAHAPASPCHADRSRAASLSLASLSRVPHPRTYSKAPHSPVPRQLLKHPPRRRPASADGLFRADTRASPRVILNLPQARHTSPRRLVMPTAAGRRRFHWRPFPASRIPAPTPKRRIRQFPANFSSTLPVAPLSRTALLRTDIRAAPWDPTETSVATAGHPFPAHPRPLPCPLAKNALPAKRGRRPAERYFRDRRLIVRLV